MKYLQIFIFPVLLSIYGIVAEKRREGYQMIEGAIITILAIGGSVIAAFITYATRHHKWADKWYVRVGFSVLGVAVAFILLFAYVQIQSMPWVQKGNVTDVIRN